MKPTKVFLFAILMCASGASFSDELMLNLKEGADYQVLDKPAGVSYKPRQIVFILNYGDGSYRRLEPRIASLDKILESKYGKSLTASLRPVLRKDEEEAYQRITFVAEMLGVSTKVNAKLFGALQQNTSPLPKVFERPEVEAMFTAEGVNREVFSKAYTSFRAYVRMQILSDAADVLYKSGSTPVMVVDDKYLLRGRQVERYLDAMGATGAVSALKPSVLPAQLQANSSVRVDNWTVHTTSYAVEIRSERDKAIRVAYLEPSVRGFFSSFYVLGITAERIRVFVDGRILIDDAYADSGVAIGEADVETIQTGKQIQVDAYTKDRGWNNSITIDGKVFGSTLQRARAERTQRKAGQ